MMKIKIIGIEDKFIEQGSREELLASCGLNSEKIINEILNG